MKNKSSKLLVLSLAALLGLAGCSSLPKGEESDKDVIGSSILVDEEGEQDEIGVAVNLRKNAASSSVSAKIGQYWGFQKIDGVDGKISIRFIVAVSGIDDIYSMYVKRTVKDEAGNSVMAEKTIAIEKVYKSLSDVSSVTWDGTNSDLNEDIHYAVYTLKNIPASHLTDRISAEIGFTKWNGSTSSVRVEANGLSFVHQATEINGLKFTVGSSNNDYVKANEVYVSASSTSLTEVAIPEKVYVAPNSYSKHVIQEATVVAIGNPSFSGYNYDGQGFYNCAKLTKITLPSTIRSFGPYVFEKCSALEEITLPESLTYIGKNAFGYKSSSYYDYTCGLKRLIWNARNLTPEDEFKEADSSSYGLISWALDKVTVGPNVEALPNKKLFGGAQKATLPFEIEWKKTEEERAALLAASPNSDFGDVENYVCSDTATITVNYHIGEGTLPMDGIDKTGDVAVETFGQGRKLGNPGNPTPLSGKKFTGWYLDEAFANKAEFPLVLGTDDVNLYAKYETAAAGEILSNPKALQRNETFTFTTSEATPSNYFTFTADKEGSDYYYFEITDFVKAADSPNDRNTYDTNLYLFRDSAFSDRITVNRSAPYKSDANGQDAYQVNVLLSKGETIYLQVAAYAIMSSSRTVYGDITLSTWTQEGDVEAEATALTKGTAASYVGNKAHQDYIPTLYKFQAEQTGYSLKLAQLGAHSVRAYAKVYDPSTGSNVASLTLSGASTESLLTGLTVGKNYLIELSSDHLSTFEEGDGVSILLSDLPAGLSADNPVEGTLGNKETISDMKAKTRYFSFNLEAGKTYHLIGWRYASSSSSSKPGCAYKVTSPSEATLSSGKIFSSAYRDYGDITLTATESGTHILSADVVDSGTWSSSAHLSNIAVVEEKSALDATATLPDGALLCVKPSAKAIYSIAVSAKEGATAKLSKLNYQYIATANASDVISGEGTLTLEANTAVFFQVSSSDGSEITLAAEKAKAALEGKPYVNKQFNGGISGKSSYWKMSIDEYGITSGESVFRNGVNVKEAAEEKGIFHLQFTYQGATTDGYTDGERIYAYCAGEEWFASSNTKYSGSAVGYKEAKTSGYNAANNGENEVKILSILEGTNRIYCVVKGSKVYLNATVEFTAGDDISAKDSAFSVKDAEGNALGSFTVTAASTIVAAA